MKRLHLSIPTLVFLLAAVAGGIYWHHSRSESPPAPVPTRTAAPAQPGRWRRHNPRNQNLTPQQAEQIKQLNAVGYLAGSRPAKKSDSITIYDRAAASDGYNLITSGHDTEAILTDMAGLKVHQWRCDAFTAWPGFEPYDDNLHTFWRRARLLENGDLLAIFEGIGIIRLDKDSNLLWARENGAHHDLDVSTEGQIYLLTREAYLNPKYNREKPVLEDFVTVLDGSGHELRKVSVLEAIEGSPYAPILGGVREWGDLLHTNTIELIKTTEANRHPAFRKGNVILSILWLDFICILDLENQTIPWGASGTWARQHQPTLLENGNLLLFDNQGVKKSSRVIEYNPSANTSSCRYGDLPDERFYSPTCGTVERLPNGNTLVTESDPGRAFEINDQRKIVWEFYNPHRAGGNDEFVATLFEVVRIDPDFPLQWLP
jgi:Arylsulfotransferase (ASST)